MKILTWERAILAVPGPESLLPSLRRLIPIRFNWGALEMLGLDWQAMLPIVHMRGQGRLDP